MTDVSYYDVTIVFSELPPERNLFRYRRIGERNIRRAVNKALIQAWSEPGVFGTHATSLTVTIRRVSSST